MYLAIYGKGLWTLEIISYWSDKLSSILDYFTLVDGQKLYFTNSVQKSGVICLSRPRIPTRLRVPTYSRPTSPSPHVPTSLSPCVPTSPSPRVPTSPRPRVPESPSPKSHVPVPLLVTADSFDDFATRSFEFSYLWFFKDVRAKFFPH